MAGKSNRSPNSLAGHRSKGNLLQLMAPSQPPPAPVEGWLEVTKQDWVAFWSSGVAGQVDRAVDLAKLIEMFTLHNEVRELREERVLVENTWRTLLETEPFIAGSKGQDRLNPLLSQLQGRISQLESGLNWRLTRLDRFWQSFGVGPLDRVRLGWSMAEGIGAAERMRRILNDGLH